MALVPGDAFGAPACVRISYAAALPVLEEGLSPLRARPSARRVEEAEVLAGASEQAG